VNDVTHSFKIIPANQVFWNTININLATLKTWTQKLSEPTYPQDLKEKEINSVYNQTQQRIGQPSQSYSRKCLDGLCVLVLEHSDIFITEKTHKSTIRQDKC